MGEYKRLAVIILNWNGLSLLKKFLPVASRFTQGPGVRLFVADNGSTDGSPDWVRRNHPEVGLIEFKENHGFAEGYNKAIQATDYSFTVLLNSDVEVTEGWWEPMLEYMESHPDSGAVQPKVKSYIEKEKFEYAGAAGGLLDSLGYPYCRGRILNRVEADYGQYDGKVEEIAWASGACLMVKTEAYKEVGGLDKRFFAHMEEVDLCVRMRHKGWKVIFLPFSEIYHVGGASLKAGDPKKTYLNFRNNLLLLHKNLPRKRGKKFLRVRRLADTLAFMMYSLKFDFPNALAVIKAHRDFRKMRKHYREFPERDIFKELPGTDRSIIFARMKK